MSTPPSQPSGAARRRSQRVFIQTKVVVFGKGAAGQSFQEETATQAVNAHGALVLMKQTVAHGQRLVLTNVTTKQDIECRVVFLGPKQGDQTQIGVEFLKPSPNYWHISFPPDDWKASGG
jgi:PilZ domain-containing protein